jgi:outer membrane protein assembly factor BamB
MNQAPATPANPVLVIGNGGNVVGLDPATGQTRWEVNTKGAGAVELAIEGGVVIAANDVNVSFIDYATGYVHAIVPLSGDKLGRPTMVVSNGQLFIGRPGEICCMTLRGQPVWKKELLGRGLRSISLGFPGNIRQADDR